VLAALFALSLSPTTLLHDYGLWAVAVIVFAESGLFVGFFLPGDSLLFTAGLLSFEGSLPALPWLLLVAFVAAVAGDQVGFLFGRRVGPALFRRPDSRLFKQENVARAQHFFDRNGAKTIVLARFVPVVRTFAPIVAGVGKMSHRVFSTFNVVGGLLWAVGVASLGYGLGNTIGAGNIDTYIYPIIAVIVVLSLVPVFLEYRKARVR
jgi:membrane-associated protein